MKLLISILAIVLCIGCSSKEDTAAPKVEPEKRASMATLSVTSPTFKANATIPKQHTCDGQNVSPPIYIADMPDNTESVALIFEELDAKGGSFVQWLLYGFTPRQATIIGQNIPGIADLDFGRFQGTNGFKKIGYMGPCPPRGESHQYRFIAYALDAMPNLKGGATRKELEKAILDDVIAHGEMTVTYGR